MHGIGWEDVADAPEFGAVWAELAALTADADYLVAHNAPFDLEFLHAELALAGQPPLLATAIDTLVIARRLFPKRQSHSLAALAIALGSRKLCWTR